MDPGLHVKQGVNHLNKVLQYAPFVVADGEAEVFLTWEDWNVVADALFHMETPREFIPEEILDYVLDSENQHIILKTTGMMIQVAVM